VAESDDAGAVGDDDERRGGHVDVATAKELRVVVVDEKTDEGEGKNVEKGDTPEDLLDRRWERAGRVLGLSSGETNEFSTGEGEGGSDENSAEASEGCERARVLPSLTTLVLREAIRLSALCVTTIVSRVGSNSLSVGRTATTDEDDAHEQEDDDGGELQKRHPEFFLSVSKNTKDGDDDNHCPEKDDPDSKVDT
jgi:hypothetical protein